MEGLGNAIKYLYRAFILRDVLSFVTPGAIIVLTALFLFFPELLSRSIHWLLYIPLFGLFFMVGFAVQCLGEFIGFIHFCPPDKSYWDFHKRLKILWCGWATDKDNMWWVKYYKEMEVKFRQAIRENTDKEEIRQERERLVVLKQMCGNGFFAVAFAGIIFLINALNASPWYLLIVGIPLVLSLFWGHRVHVLRQYAREKVIMDSLQKGK